MSSAKPSIYLGGVNAKEAPWMRFLNSLKKGKRNFVMLSLALPLMIYLFIFNYIPMLGTIIAFKNYRYDLGFLKSQWVGLDNFKFFFFSPDAWRITRNTVAYNLVFIVLGLVVSVFLAVMLYEVKNRAMLKVYQTTMFFPSFLSWVVVAFMAYSFLNPMSGILNAVYKSMGWEPIDWYIKSSPWIFILPLANIWKTAGMSTLIYYASLMGIDQEYFEAATLDGASRWKVTRYITLPFLYPLMIIMTILAIGQIFNADFGLFYQVPMNSAMLYPTTDVIETYVFRALRETSNISMSSAAGLYKSMVGFILVLITNAIVSKLNPDNALF